MAALETSSEFMRSLKTAARSLWLHKKTARFIAIDSPPVELFAHLDRPNVEMKLGAGVVNIEVHMKDAPYAVYGGQ